MQTCFWINSANYINGGWDVTTNKISFILLFLNTFSLDKRNFPILLSISFSVYPCYINQDFTVNICCCNSFFFLSTIYLSQFLTLWNLVCCGRQSVLRVVELSIHHWLKVKILGLVQLNSYKCTHNVGQS